MATTGYSGTPLAKKLGIKNGFKIRLVNQPDHYLSLSDQLPADIVLLTDKRSGKNLVHYFTTKAKELQRDMPLLKKEIRTDGMSWNPGQKRQRSLPLITEDLVRKLALDNGLVDVQVCAVDEVWSGLKLVIAVKERAVLRKLM